MVSDRRYGLDDLVWLVQQSWMRLCLSATAEQVDRAKIQLKSAYLLQLDGTTPLAEDIGRQLLCYGERMHLGDIFAAIDAVDPAAVQAAAHKYIYDKCPAVAAFGPVESMPDYNRIRSGMRWLRN